ncbi:tyrosine-type recombinase/integrase [Vibrio chagasii]|uniref:tyrosine-type recombinase/integrase n=1 Tax=Vibrio chagasii TaxID=170679 RepID=UPI003DA16498
MRLTKNSIQNLKPRKSKYTVVDGGTGSVEGLRIVIQPSGRKTWAVYYETGKRLANGRKQKASISLGSVDTISIEAARKQASDVANKTTGATVYQKKQAVESFEAERQEVDYIKPRLSELFEVYLKDRQQAGAKTVNRSRRYLLEHLPSWLLNMEAREVKMSEVEKALDATYSSDSSWNGCLILIKAAFGLAYGTAKIRDQFALPEFNTISQIRKKRVKIQTGYIPTLEDLAELWVEAPSWMTAHSANLTRAIIAGCGSRPAEIQLRKWDDIKFVKHEGQNVRLLVMEDTKMNKPHSLVCNDLMWECIKEADRIRKDISRHQEELLFPSSSPYLSEYANTSGIGNSIRRARTAGAITNPITLKHVRHAFSTILGDNGVSANVIARCQNHSLGSQVNERHYSRATFVAEKLEGSQVWNKLLTEAIERYLSQKEQEDADHSEMLKQKLAAG